MKGYNSGQQLYLPLTNSTADAFALTAGRKTLTSFASPNRLIHLADASGVDIEFCGTDQENETVNYKLWAAKIPSPDVPSDAPTAASIYLFGSGTFTLGTATGVGDYFAAHLAATGAVLTFADTLTFSLATWGQYVVDTYQLVAPTPYSPADNTVACLSIPLLSRVCNALVIEFDRGTGADAANALYSLTD